MTIEDVKAFITQNENDEQVKAFVDSLADKRVTSAQQKWEKLFPERVNEAIAARDAQARAMEERRTQVSLKLGELFTEAKIDSDWAEPFMPEDLGALSDDDIEPTAERIIGTVKTLRENFLKDKYGAPAPRGGGGSMEATDPSVAEFRQAMGLRN